MRHHNVLHPIINSYICQNEGKCEPEKNHSVETAIEIEITKTEKKITLRYYSTSINQEFRRKYKDNEERNGRLNNNNKRNIEN